MFEQPILIFSDYCAHSKSFKTLLAKHPQLYNSFAQLNIDSRPPVFYQIQNTLQHKITEVPTIILKDAEYVLSGSEAFKWLNFQIEESNKKEELDPFNPNEMGSFSDPYCSIGSKGLHDNAKTQSFKFIGQHDERIYTPTEDSEEHFQNTTMLNNKQQEFDQRYQQLLQDRDNI